MTNQMIPLPKRVRNELEFRREDLESILPEWITYKRFVNMSLMAITRTPKLAECEFSSIYLSLMECARLGLYPDGRQAAIVPYKGKATLLPMVQGIIELMLRAPKVAKVEARVVYDGDRFDYAYGLNSRLDHVPSGDGAEGREIIASYAIVFWEHTQPTFEVVNRDELDKARQSSAAPNSPAWVIWEGEQCRKVATKRVSKYVDLTPEAQLLIEWDHAVYGDPTMEGSVEGPTQEYKNQHVKAETEAKLESLKEKIKPETEPERGTKEELNEESGDTEPPAEDEKKKEPEPDQKPKPEEPVRIKNQWEKPILKFLIDNELVSGEDKAVRQHRLANILNQSPFTDIPFGKLDIVEATAWVLGWEKIKEAHPRKKWENRLKQVQELWEDETEKNALIDLAMNKVPPE